MFPFKANILRRIYTWAIRTQIVKSAIIYLPMSRGHCKKIEAKISSDFWGIYLTYLVYIYKERGWKSNCAGKEEVPYSIKKKKPMENKETT